MSLRQAYQCCARPCSRTTGSPAPTWATWNRAPRAVTNRWVTPGTCGIAQVQSCRTETDVIESSSGHGGRRKIGGGPGRAHSCDARHVVLVLTHKTRREG